MHAVFDQPDGVLERLLHFVGAGHGGGLMGVHIPIHKRPEFLNLKQARVQAAEHFEVPSPRFAQVKMERQRRAAPVVGRVLNLIKIVCNILDHRCIERLWICQHRPAADLKQQIREMNDDLGAMVGGWDG